jgi:hypothetical protein
MSVCIREASKTDSLGFLADPRAFSIEKRCGLNGLQCLRRHRIEKYIGEEQIVIAEANAVQKTDVFSRCKYDLTPLNGDQGMDPICSLSVEIPANRMI